MYVLLILILVLFLMFCYLLKPVKPSNAQIKPFYHRNFAHRGLHSKDKTVPENSLPAFRLAVEHDYGIELDIQFSKDFQIVVFHDSTLDRVCGVHGRVDDFTYEELKQMKLCGQNEHIPLFSEVLKVVDGKIPMIVELKTGPHNNELCSKAYGMLKAYQGDYCIESFDPFIVNWFYSHAPAVLRGQLSAPYSELKKELSPGKAFFLSNCFSNAIAHPNFIAYDKIHMPFTVKLAYLLGAMRVVWTPRDTDDVKALEAVNDAMIFEFYLPSSRYD